MECKLVGRIQVGWKNLASWFGRMQNIGTDLKSTAGNAESDLHVCVMAFQWHGISIISAACMLA